MRYGCEWLYRDDTCLHGYAPEWQAAEELSAEQLQSIIDTLPADTWLYIQSNKYGWLTIPIYLMDAVKPQRG